MRNISQICSVPAMMPEIQLLNNISNCNNHGQKVQFMCFNDQCENNCLICPQCLVEDHRLHDIMTLKDFLNDEIKKMIGTGTSSLGDQLRQASLDVLDNIKQSAERVNKKNQTFYLEMRERMEQLKIKYPVNQQFDLKGFSFNNSNAVKLKYIIKRQRVKEWIPLMQKFINKVIQEVQGSIINIINDAEELFHSQMWDQQPNKYDDEVFNGFRQHLHPHKQQDPQYFHLSEYMRGAGLSLSLDKLQSIFSNNRPNKVGIVTNKPFDEDHNHIAFEIVQQTKTLLLLSNVLLAIGVCQLSVVRSKGFRHLSYAGSGCFMIGNTGWTYHHKLAKYDRRPIVGWTFGKGDVIEMEVNFKQAKVKFIRRGYFRKQFEMEIANPGESLKGLHACIYFDGEIGSKVRIINF